MMLSDVLCSKIVRMVSAASIYLADDVKKALRDAYEREEGSIAKSMLRSLLENIRVAEEEKRPLCQDTGTIIYYVKAGEGFPFLGELPSILRKATVEATFSVPLRPNAVDVFTGENSGDNTGERIPWMEWEITPESDEAEITVMLKGGGSEKLSLAKAVPPGLGVKEALKLVIDDVYEAGPMPCPPIVVGVGLGPTCNIAMSLAARALLRPLGAKHPRAEVARLEERLLNALNALGWGPHGVGGSITALDAHIEIAHRHPAALAVGIMASCWAKRTSTLKVTKDGVEFITHRFLNSEE